MSSMPSSVAFSDATSVNVPAHHVRAKAMKCRVLWRHALQFREVDHLSTRRQLQLGEQTGHVGRHLVDDGLVGLLATGPRRFAVAHVRPLRRGGLVGRWNAGRVDQHRAGCLEEGPAVSLVGLEVVALGPFVPGHDEEVVLLGADSGERVDGDAQPVLVAARRGVVVDGGTAWPASGVVPPHHHRREPLPGAVEELHGRFGCRLVVEHPVPSERLECRVQLAAHDGHEPHRGVEAERLRSLAARRRPPRSRPSTGTDRGTRLSAPRIARSRWCAIEVGIRAGR